MPTVIFKGGKCINKFIPWVLDKQKLTQQIMKQYFSKRLIITNKDEEIYNNSHICWICKQKLNTDKVRDQCHVTGKFRGAANNKCNLKLRIPRKLPIIFLNLQGYDGHIIFKELNDFDVNVHKTLASNLKDEDFKHLTSEFGIDKLEILKRKDAYPYEWVDSYEKFNYQQLPPKECFYSSLKMVKEIIPMDIFLMSNIYICKMFGKNLNLIILKIFIIIT